MGFEPIIKKLITKKSKINVDLKRHLCIYKLKY